MANDSDSQAAAFLAAGSVSLGILGLVGVVYLLVQAVKLLKDTAGEHPLNVPLMGAIVAFLICLGLALYAQGQDVLLDIATVVTFLVAVAIAKFIQTSEDPFFQRELNREEFAHMVTEPWWDDEREEDVA
jgi:hydrogenase-4 membrane subunit HyfE